MTFNPATSSAPSGLLISELLPALAPFEPKLVGARQTRVFGVQQDSRRVQAGDLFVARTGSKIDGRQFVSAAVAAGAVAILTDGDVSSLSTLQVPVIGVTNARRAAAFAAEATLGFPSRQLRLVGITGTNGKTTTVALVQHALSSCGAKAARLGTVGFSFGTLNHDSNLTTPEADDVSRLIAQVSRAQGSHFVMEVSSHALDQGRVDALSFDVAAFTNLTEDHLDHHGDMAHYEAAKLRLFTDLTPATSVINVDDPSGRRIAEQARSRRLIRVGRQSCCDVRPAEIEMDARGIRGALWVAGSQMSLSTRLVGEHNLDNILLAAGIFHALDVDLQAALHGLAGELGVPGRLERCDLQDDDILVLVDYAHTPDALERALQTVRRLTSGAVHCVFGCGGDRDSTKRPKMGAAVGRWSDRATITNDNPRTEEPALIAAAIEPGIRQFKIPYQVELDRSIAIRDAVLVAKPGDVVLIAGKGHEPYQIIGTVKRPFDDREQARSALQLRRKELAGQKGGDG